MSGYSRIRFVLLSLLLAISTVAQAAVQMVPAAAPRGARVLLIGTALDTQAITVRFPSASGYVPATVTNRTSATVELIVPSTAVSGDVRVQAASSEVVSLPFTVSPDTPFAVVRTLVASAAGREPLKLPGGVEFAGPSLLTADRMHHRIAAIAPDGATSSYAGSGRGGLVDGPLATAEFRNPQAIAWDPTRTAIYVADTGNHAIRRIAHGQVTTIAGTGQRGDRDGTRTSAEFTLPSGIAVGSDGTIYVADTGNHKIKAISPAGDVVTIAGTGRAGALDGQVSELRSPEGVAVGADGVVWVADSGNNLLRRISGGVLVTVSGSARRGYADGGLAVAQFDTPTDIDIDPFGALIVTDTGNGVIRYVDLGRGAVSTLVGTQGRGMTDGPAATALFRNPGSAARAADGHLALGDTGNDAVRLAFLAVSATAVYPRMSGLSGTSIRIFGTGFVDGETTVSIGGQTVQPAVVDGTMLIVAAPPMLTTQVVDVTVVGPGGTATLADAFTYAGLPTITSIVPNKGTTAGGDRVTVTGSNFAPGQTHVTFGSAEASIASITASSITVDSPAQSAGTVDITVRTPSGTAVRSSGFTYLPPPVIESFSPRSGDPGVLVTITGRNFDPVPANNTVAFGLVPASVSSSSETQLVVRVPAGAATAPITIRTSAGTATSAVAFVVPVYVELTVEPASVTLNLSESRQLAAKVRSSDGSVRDLTSVVTWTVGDARIASVNATGQVQGLRGGITSVSARHAQLTGSATVRVTAVEIPPPDPRTTAPPTDPTAPTIFTDSIKFLYEGPNATQRGVTPGAIVSRRVSVVRGRVADASGTPLSGVRVAVHRAPEVGYTVSRADGAFDLVVNGGGTPIVAFTKDGYVPVHRAPAAAWNDMVVLDEVRMTPYDSAVTAIPLAELTAHAVAQGSVTIDESGTRRATLVFQPGTSATMRFANGAVQPLPELHVRATEQTVGRVGAMPAELPPESAYTYCVELSADEAVSAGATTVEFTKPVFVYVDNFLGFPVGGRVPAGYYDREQAQWIASDDGRIIRILTIAGGVATIDTDGDNTADDGAAVGITEAERRTLASLYAEGKSIWRVPVTHFTPWDYNWGWGPPDGAEAPGVPAPYAEMPLANEACQDGSVIECESLSLGQSIPISGTPFTLEYRSRNMPGYRPKTDITVTLSGAVVPSPLKRIDLELSIAGKQQRHSFSAVADQKQVFSWDAADAYGRTVYGDRLLKISIHYVYDGVFREPAGADRTFGAGGGRMLGVNTRREIPMSQDFVLPLRGPRPSQGFGGWTLSAIHAYDPTARMLRLGTGTDVALDSRGMEITGRTGTTWDYVATGPDGSLYTYTGGRPTTLRRITPDGFVETLAGGGTTMPGDGVPAVGAWLSVSFVSVLRNGEIAFLDDFAETIYRIDSNGILRRLYAGESIGHMAAGGAGIYFVENGALKRVDLGGNVSVIRAPTDTDYVTRVFTSGSGELYVIMRDVPPDDPYSGVERLHRGVDGDLLYVFPQIHHYSWFAVDPSGRIVMGGDRGLWQVVDRKVEPYPLSRPAGTPTTISFLPNGEIIWADAWNEQVCPFAEGRYSCIIAGGFPVAMTAGDGGFNAAAPDGVLGIKFGVSGKHIETRDTRLGTLMAKISYDIRHGFSTRLEDADGLATVIERDAAGIPIAIVAPNGDRTELVLGSDGFLEEIRGPGGVNHGFTYTPSGLMRTHRNARGKTSTYQYDTNGRLQSAADAGSGSKTGTFSESGNTDTVRVTTAEGRTWTYLTRRQDIGSVDRTVTDPAGLTFRMVSTPNSIVTVAPDGTRMNSDVQPDSLWKTMVPIPVRTVLRLPSGKAVTVTSERSTFGNQANPYASSVTETVLMNGLAMTTMYDAPSRTIRTTSPLNRAISGFFNEKGRLRELRAPGMAPVVAQYDTRGRLETVTQGDRVRRFVWNGRDQLESMVTATGRSTSFEYDAAGRVKSQTFAGGGTISYTYDSAGNLLTLTPAGRPAHVFTYDDVGLADDYLTPTGSATRYVFNRDRQLTELQQPGGLTIGLTYDRGRLLRMSGGGRHLSYGYHGGGQVQSISDSSGPSLTFGFDGPLPTSMSWTGDIAGTVAWTYDNNLRVASESVDGVAIAYGYDDDSLVTGAGSEVIRREPVSGRVSGTTIGAIVDSYAYNAFGEIERYTVTQNGSTIFSIVYTRDKSGRILTKTENRFGFRVVDSYDYNAAGQLETVKRDGTVTAVYGYDSNGNRASHAAATPVASTTYDADDRQLAYGATTYTYSPWGALSTRTDASGTTTFDYDAFGNLRSVNRPGAPVVEYVIDGENRRVAKKLGGVIERRWLYRNGLNIVAEVAPSGAMTRFVYGTRANVPDYMIRSGTVYRFLVDHLGSVRYVLDATTGAIMQSVNYDEFGRVVFDSNPGYQPFGFAGGLYDPDTGLVRFGARDYDAHTGRWTAKDPMGFGGGDTNLYVYALNDPVNLIDPTGLLFGGTVNAGEAYGQAALDSYADILADPDSEWYEMAGAAVGGFFSALWTPCTSDKTFTTLSTAAGAGAWARQPYWRYVGPRSNPNSPWLSRGWKPPYGTDYARAKDALQLPYMPTGVQRTPVPWWQPVRGPRPAIKHPEWGSGGGPEYARRWLWPE